MNPDDVYDRFQELQQYVGWTDENAQRVRLVAELLEPHLPALIDDFYAEIDRHLGARKVITGGQAQVERLKCTLRAWIRELLFGPYDRDYVARRWRVGWRHVDIGLDQVYTNVALSRLRRGLLQAHEDTWRGSEPERLATRVSLNMLLDLELALISDAYRSEYQSRQQTLARERGEAVFRTLVEAAPCMIVILRPDRSVVYFSPFAETVTGNKAEEVLGKDYFPLFISDKSVQVAVLQEMERALSGRPIQGFENAITCKDGSQRWVVWNALALPDYEGGPAVLAVGQDITTLKRAQQQAVQAERLAAIGQMMTGLAHESGNALARSQACLEMLGLAVRDRPDALDLIARIQKAQDHLQQLYEEVRTYAAPFKLDREVWDLALIWRQAWNNLAVLRQGRDAEVHEETDGVDRKFAFDVFRLEQVFRNILENALAACTDPVRISIRCTRADLGGRPALRVAVSDNGPGMTPEQARRVFEPFFTTKTKGTGLGMAIAKRIVEAHGGAIAVGSNCPGRGAEIVITLPRESV
jgi:PAS domain S-box-containing protein